MATTLYRQAIAIAAAACLWSGSAEASDIEVDVELVLAVDASNSMNENERSIQRKGYATALRDPNVLKAIRQGRTGTVAVTYFEWAGSGSYRLIVPWRRISNYGEAEAFAAAILRSGDESMRRTSVSAAIDIGASLFDGNGFDGERLVIDVSGDGANNSGRPVDLARDEAVGRGITINGLPLMTNTGDMAIYDIADIDAYYANCVIGGPGAFSIPVKSWDEFPAAVRRKLVLELSGPAMLAGRIYQAAARPAYDCLIGEKMWQRLKELLGR